jgi:concanavalin A-like lectin/glucanase superfamily protein
MKPVRVVTTLAVLASLALPAVASADADFPLRGWWPLNEGKGQTVRDWSGKGNTGFLGSTPQADANDPTWTKGIFFGSALNFNGNQFVTIPDDDSLEPQALTVGAWVRAAQSPGTYRYVLAKGGQDCVSSSYGLQTSFHGGLEFFIWDGQNQRWSGNIAAAQIWDGRWHHVAGTYDGTNAKLFVDGKQMPGGSTATSPIDYQGPTGGGTIGGYHGTCDLLFTGDIAEVHVWSQALPVDQIWKKWGWLLGIPGKS